MLNVYFETFSFLLLIFVYKEMNLIKASGYFRHRNMFCCTLFFNEVRNNIYIYFENMFMLLMFIHLMKIFSFLNNNA